MIMVDAMVDMVARINTSTFLFLRLSKSICREPANNRKDRTPCMTKSVKLIVSSIDEIIRLSEVAGVSLSKTIKDKVTSIDMITMMMLLCFWMNRSLINPNMTAIDTTIFVAS